MFGSSKITQLETVIGSDACIKGDIEFSGGLHIEGKVVGDIHCAETAVASRVVVAKNASVEGNLNVGDIDINGRIRGNIFASGKVELLANARVDGSIHYRVLQMDSGAQFNGELICKDDSGARESLETINSHTKSTLALNIDPIE